MRRPLLLSALCLMAMTWAAGAATGHVLKVLPLYLDKQGRESLSPSLYDRDAYQAILRLHPAQRSGIRFATQWKAKGPAWEPLKLRVEIRGVAEGNLPKQLVLERDVQPTSWLGKWTYLPITGDEYKAIGDVTAWRVTLWEGQQLLSEQKSFLW